MKEVILSGASPVLMPNEDPAGKILFAILLLVFLLVCFVALMIFLGAVLRGMTERSNDAIGEAPLRIVFTGLIGYAVFGGLAAWLYSEAFVVRLLETELVPGFLGAAVLVTILPLLASLLGAPGAFSYVGDRIAALHGGEVNGFRRMATGTLVSVFAALFPIIGWFVIAPLLLAISFGANVTTIFRRGHQRG